jgi:cytochrome d ubiquinol oxidase subunit II
VTSWLNATSIFIGVLSVATAAYLAAVYLAADAVRVGRADIADAYRSRALGMGVVAGALALAGLAIVRHDATRIWDGLTGGSGLAAVIVSGVAGVATLGLVFRRRFGPARVTAALAVAAILAGWALAQRPEILPGLTVEEAAAGHSALVAVIVGVALGAILLLPSLALLLGLLLRGRFDPHAVEPELPAAPVRASVVNPRLGVAAAACLAVGGTLTFFFETPWAHIIGVSALLAFVGLGFVALAAVVATGDQPD